MNRSLSIWMLSIVNILVSVPLFAAATTSSQLRCPGIFSSPSLKRGLEIPKIDWKNDLSYLQAAQRKEIYGQVETTFSKKWDTQIYYTKTGLPNSKGEVPLIDPNAKAVYIFFHGSGTMKSSGRNFIGNMNTLANLGYAAVSFDMPFHGEGPRSPEFNKSNYFMEWVRSLVLEAKKAKKPVYLAGHSFGPDVILEFATRYPKTIDGIVALSPAGFTKTLSHWYDNFTSKMKFGGDVPENETGGIWAAIMSNLFLWTKHKLPDPTLINPKLNIRILSGNREEYVPAPLDGEGQTLVGENTYDISAPLKSMFKNATVTIEPGIGHYLFEHLDKDGYNVVLRELLAVDGISSSQIKMIAEQVRRDNRLFHSPGKLAKKYVQDPLFRNWSDQNYGPGKVLQLAHQNLDVLADKIFERYSMAEKERDAEIYKKILNTKETHPLFYEKYKALLDKANPEKVDATLFYPYMTMILQTSGGPITRE